MNIEKTLQERFAAPLQENYKRRIVFWQDPEGEFSSMVNELCLDGVKILKLTGTNNFAANNIKNRFLNSVRSGTHIVIFRYS